MIERDNAKGLRDFAAETIKRVVKALDVSPYAQGPDKAELCVRFWTTLASMAQNRCGLAKAAVGGEGLTSTGYMTRKEAAQYLRVSTRQLDRLRLPRSTLGARPRYSREILDEHLQRRMTAPPERTKGGLVRPPYLSPARKGPTDIKKLIDSWR